MNTGDIWLNPQLFLVSLGLTADGGTVADFTDSEATKLAESIKALRLSRNIREWFSHARTGQVKVNPYWPRGSTLAAACFFINEEGRLDAPLKRVPAVWILLERRIGRGGWFGCRRY